MTEFSKNKSQNIRDESSATKDSSLLWMISMTTYLELILSGRILISKNIFLSMICFRDIFLYLSASFKEKYGEEKLSEDKHKFFSQHFLFNFLGAHSHFHNSFQQETADHKKKLSIHALEWQKKTRDSSLTYLNIEKALEKNFSHRKKRQEVHINCW